MALSVYLVGREIGDWPTARAPINENQVFAAIRNDGTRIESMAFQHCTFANVSFKEAKINRCTFLNCAFVSCYFRKSELIGSTFVGCKFLSCEFPRVTVQSCDFKYSRFENCAIPFDEMEHSLPQEPNLREELASGLAIAADSLGIQRDGRRYRLAAIRARKKHLYAAVMSQSEWYQNHYTGLRKLMALGQLIASHGNGAVWGHGEKPLVLICNMLLIMLIVFPILLWLASESLQDPSGPITVFDIVWTSVVTFIPISAMGFVTITGGPALLILTIEAFLGVVSSGLLITILVRRMVKR